MKLSVIVVGDAGTPASQRCSESLSALLQRERLEVLPGPLEQGLRAASGDFIAILSERYQPRDGWCEAIIQEHMAGAGVVGGCVAPGDSLCYFGWCIYLAEYSHVAPPMERIPDLANPRLIPAGNVSYARNVSALLSQRGEFGEIEFHSRLGSQGVRLCFTPGMTVDLEEPPPLSDYLRERRRRSRLHAARLAAGRSPSVRFFRGAATVVLPLILLWRVVENAVARRRFGGRLLISLPVLLSFALVHAWGELEGWFGLR
jgi:hypothetical protein